MISGAGRLWRRPGYLLLIAGLAAGNFVSCSSPPTRPLSTLQRERTAEGIAGTRVQDQPGTPGNKPSACIKFEKNSGRAAKPTRRAAKGAVISREVPTGREKQLQAENEIQVR